MARRIRWQLLVATVSALMVLGLMSALALSTTAVSQPLAGGDYVEGVSAPPLQINPLLSDPARDPTSADIQALLFDGLIKIDSDGLPAPALASGLPEVSPDGTTYTFTIRQGVTWHDGAPLTPDDVVFTLRSVQNQAFTGDPAAAGLWRNTLIDKVGEDQVRVQLGAPFSPFVSQAIFPILPAHLLRDVPPEQWGMATFSQQPVGTGPYRLEELTAERALLEANPDYYGGAPLLDRIELRFFGSLPEELAALTRGEVDAIGYTSTAGVKAGNLPRTASRSTAPLDSYSVLTFNLREAPLSDQGLRRALAIGLDKDALIAEALDDEAQRLDTPLLPGAWIGHEPSGWYPYDPARAADLLSSLGYEPGNDGVRARDGAQLSLSLITDEAPDRLAAADNIVKQWGALGVKVAVERLSSADLEERLASHQFTLALHGWQRLGPDPDVYELWHSDRADAGRNFAGLEDDQVDELLASARLDEDIESRLASYAAFQRRWIELAPSITLYQPLYVHIAPSHLGGLDFGSPSALSGAHLLYGREDRFRNVNRWFIRSTREIGGDLRQAP